MILKNNKRIDGCSDTVPIGSLNPFIGTTAPFGYLICQGQKVSKVTYPELYSICGTTFGPETSTEFTLPDLRGVTIAGYKEGDSTFGTLGGLIGSITKSYTPEGTNTGGSVGNHTLTTDEIPSHRHAYWHSNSATDLHTLTIDQIPSHSHSILRGTAGDSWFGFSSREVQNPPYSGTTEATGGGQGHQHSLGGYWDWSSYECAGGAHNHNFTQPTFTGIQTNINVVQPTMTLNWIVKAIPLMPNQSTVVNTESDSPTNVYSASFVNDLLEQMKKEAFDFAHPVGSYYETSDSTWTPQSAGWYGTWVADNDGSALVSYKSSGAFNKATGTIVGGETTSYTPAGSNSGTAVTLNAIELTHSGGAVGNHKLVVSEIPSHTHGSKSLTGAADFRRYSEGSTDIWGTGWASTRGIINKTTGTWSGTHSTLNTYGLSMADPTVDTLNINATHEHTSVGGDGNHNHPFTQPSKHSFTPTTKSITQPTFTGTKANVSTIQTSKVVYRWHRTA